MVPSVHITRISSSPTRDLQGSLLSPHWLELEVKALVVYIGSSHNIIVFDVKAWKEGHWDFHTRSPKLAESILLGQTRVQFRGEAGAGDPEQREPL